MKRMSIILLVIAHSFVSQLKADTISAQLPANVSCTSQVHLNDTIKSNIDVAFVDNTQDEWSWYKFLSLLVGAIVPLSSVWLAWKLNRDNNAYNITKQKAEMQNKHDEELQQKKILKQGEILEAMNTLDSRCRTKNYPDKDDIKKISDGILVAYPFLGKDLYKIAKDIIATIEKYVPQTETDTKVYTAEDAKTIKENIAAFLKLYNANVNS